MPVLHPKDAFTLQWELGTDQVARICQVPYRTLDSWMRTGLLSEPMVPANGHGSARVWSLADTVRARMVARLRRELVSLQSIRKALAILADEWDIEDPLASGMLLVVGGQLFWVPDDATLVHILARQQASRVLLIDVGELARETAEKVAALVT